MDALSTMLRAQRLHARVFLHSRFCGDWAVDTSGTRQATFHVVARGSCWLHLPDGTSGPRALRAGDLVVFPRDARHVLSNSATPPDAHVARNRPAADHDAGPSSSLICGYFGFGERHWNPLLDALPDHLVLDAETASGTGRLDALIRFLIHEAEAEQVGADTVIDRLSDVLFIHVVRAYIRQERSGTGFLAALAEPRLGAALNAFLASPGGAWNVARLARQAGMSRAAFARHFHETTGQTPMQFVTRWRMQRARELLSGGRHSVAQVAEQSGYGSEAAFSKAFKKVYATGPGAIRRAAGNGST